MNGAARFAAAPNASASKRPIWLLAPAGYESIDRPPSWTGQTYQVRIHLKDVFICRLADAKVGPMPSYRAYILDGQSNILLREEIEASEDRAAIDLGWELVALHAEKTPISAGVEIWHGDRLVFSSHPRV